MRVYARGKLGKTSYLRKIILKKTFRCRPKLPDGTNDVCVGSCDVCTRSGTMGNDHVGVCARGKKFKKSERKKVAEEKKTAKRRPFVSQRTTGGVRNTVER